MKPLKLSLALSLPLALAAIAAPAAAATDFGRHAEPAAWNQRGDHAGLRSGMAGQLRADIARLDRRIDRAQAQHRISPREAAGLHRDVNGLERTFASFARGGIDRSEARALQLRIDRVERALAREGRDFNNRPSPRQHR